MSQRRSHDRPIDALVTNAWGRSAYNVVRSLARHRLRVLVGTDKFRGMAAISRYAAGTFRHPLVTTEPGKFIDRVKEVIDRHSPRVYLPTGEETYVAAKYRSELQSAGTAVPVASYQTIRTLHKKDDLIAHARSLGIPTPETIRPRDLDDVRHFSRRCGDPIVLKRISSTGARGVFYTTGADVRADSIDDPAGEPVNLGQFILQQFVRGTGYGVSMLFNHGQLRAKFTHKRLRETSPTGGVSSLRMSVSDPILEDYAQRLLESVHFHGVAMVEFKRNETTGQTWLLEVNPRFWGSLALAIQSGVDFPHLLFRMAIDGDVAPVTNYRLGVVVKWILGDLAAALRDFRSGSNSPQRNWPRVAGYDDFFWDDPLASVGGAVLSAWRLVETRTWRHDEIALGLEQLERA